MTIGAKSPIVIVNSSMLRSFDEKAVETVLAHEAAHVLSEHYTYTTALVLLSQFLWGALPCSLLLGLPGTCDVPGAPGVVAGRRALGRPGGGPGDGGSAPALPRLMELAGGSVPGMNFEAFLRQASEYDSEDDLSSCHTRFWSELNLTHPVAVRRVKELTEWVQTGAYDRIRDGDYPRRGEEPPPSKGVRGRRGALPRAVLADPRPDGGRGPGDRKTARRLAGALAEPRGRGAGEDVDLD